MREEIYRTFLHKREMRKYRLIESYGTEAQGKSAADLHYNRLVFIRKIPAEKLKVKKFRIYGRCFIGVWKLVD